MPPETSNSCLCHFLQSEVHTTKFVDKLLITWISVPTFDLNIASFFFFFHFSSPLIRLACLSSEIRNLQAVFLLCI